MYSNESQIQCDSCAHCVEFIDAFESIRKSTPCENETHLFENLDWFINSVVFMHKFSRINRLSAACRSQGRFFSLWGDLNDINLFSSDDEFTSSMMDSCSLLINFCSYFVTIHSIYLYIYLGIN